MWHCVGSARVGEYSFPVMSRQARVSCATDNKITAEGISMTISPRLGQILCRILEIFMHVSLPISF